MHNSRHVKPPHALKALTSTGLHPPSPRNRPVEKNVENAENPVDKKMTPFPIPYFSTFSTYIYNHLHISLLFIKKEIQNMIINKCGENGGGENSGRKRAADGERQERSPPPWHERHGKDGRRHGEQKKKDGGKETPAKKTVTVRDGRRGAEGGKGRNRGDACWPAM